MKISEMNWMQVEAYLAKRRPRRAAARQHRAARAPQPHRRLHPAGARRGRGGRAARRAGVPGGRYGVTPYFLAFPGSISPARRDLSRGDRRHPRQPRRARASGASSSSTAMAATQPAQSLAIEWMADHPGVPGQVPQLVERAARPGPKVQEIDPVASHASWMENFPWTRLPRRRQRRRQQKPMIDLERMRADAPQAVRSLSRRRQLRRALPAPRRGHAGDLAGRGRGDAGAARRTGGRERRTDPGLGRRRHRRHDRRRIWRAPATT